MALDCLLTAEAIDEAANYLLDENVLPCATSVEIAESLTFAAMAFRNDVPKMKNALITLFEMLRHLEQCALEEALDEMDLSDEGFQDEMNAAKAVVGWEDSDVLS